MTKKPIPPEQLEIWQDEADEPTFREWVISGALLFGVSVLLCIGAGTVINWALS